MNKSKLSNPVRLIAFFLTALMLICTFGFAVDGWNLPSSSQPIGQNLPSTEQGSIGNIEEEIEADEPLDEPLEPEIIIPKYYNRITGLECSEEISKNAHLAFVMDSTLPIYGLSFADMVCEIPIEDGSTRMCLFISDTSNLWKIGSLTQSRGYISNIIRYLGGVCISNGNDDQITYPSCDMNNRYIDLLNGNYQYTEFTSNVYTNKDLLDSAIQNSSVSLTDIDFALPYDFVEINSEDKISSSVPASSITITGALGAMTEFKYNNETEKYLLYKNGSLKTDSINNKSVEFTNCFVLFADSITYDNEDCNQMIMDTVGTGAGFYFTNGSVIEIKWVGMLDSCMTFYTLDGERLCINRGTSYISFLKTSKRSDLSYQ